MPRLTAPEAAERLGVKIQTLYAYVSRGLLARERDAAGSSFDPLEIEAFALRRVRRRASGAAITPAAASTGSPLMVIDTDIAVVEDDRLYFRGRPAAELAAAYSFDAVAAWIWGEPLDARRRLRVDPAAVRAARHLVTALPGHAALIDRAAVAVHGLAAADPLRNDPDPAALPRAGEILVAGIPRALAGADPDGADLDGAHPYGAHLDSDIDDVSAASVADWLWSALTEQAPTTAQLAMLDAALVLSIDHDLAISTLAARVAASGRASGYAVVTAALGAFDSPLHGNSGLAAYEMLQQVRAGVPAQRAIAARLRAGGQGVPGFGHSMYAGMDDRARTLLPMVGNLPGGGEVLDAVDALSSALASAGLHPNLDLALAACALANGLGAEAPSLIFATGRIPGWIAHAGREYDAAALRLRPRGRYVGPPPRGQAQYVRTGPPSLASDHHAPPTAPSAGTLPERK